MRMTAGSRDDVSDPTPEELQVAGIRYAELVYDDGEVAPWVFV